MQRLYRYTISNTEVCFKFHQPLFLYSFHLVQTYWTDTSCVQLPARPRGMDWKHRTVRASCGKVRGEHLGKATGNDPRKTFHEKNMKIQKRASTCPPASGPSLRLDGGQRATRVKAAGARTVSPPNWRTSGGSSPIPAGRMYESDGPYLNRSLM